MRHWDLIKNYPKIAEETSEAIEDLLDTFKANLEALDKIGEPITSNIVIIDLLSSKVLSSLVRKWQRTLPDKRMPSYTHLMDFLQTRTNSDDIRPRSPRTIVSSHKSSHHRQHQPRGQTFNTTYKPLKFPTCRGSHELNHCKVFKTRSATKRWELVKRASLYINCIGRGHSRDQCSAGSCRKCGHRYHTYLHREHTKVNLPVSSVRSSSDRSSSGRSSSGRSSSGQSSSGNSSSGQSPNKRSSHKHSSHHSKRTTIPSRESPSPPRNREPATQHESRPSWTTDTGSNSSQSPQN
jgi:hypothetical protein